MPWKLSLEEFQGVQNRKRQPTISCSTERMRPVAFWASWVDALPMLSDRLPSGERAGDWSRRHTVHVGNVRGHPHPRSKWFRGQTRVASVENGAPTSRGIFEPGGWQHGWQYHASSPLQHHFRETVILAKSCAADQAHLCSHAGAGASDVLHGAPTGPEFKVEPHLFRTLVLGRLRGSHCP